MSKTKFPLNHKLIIKPTWFIQKDESKMYDSERQEYIMMIHDNDIQKSIKNRDYDVCTELMFHGLNINALKDNNTYYNTKHEVIMNSEFSKLYTDIKNNKSHNFYEVIENFKKYIYTNIKQYTDMISIDLQKVNIYIKNKKIHNEEDIYIICDDGYKITIYLNSYGDDYILGNTINIVKEFSGENAQNEYNEFIIEYNKSADSKMNHLNTIGMNIDTKIGTIKTIKMLRSIITANKWFNSQNFFLFDIFKNLFNKEEIKSFEYRFS